MKGTIRKQRKRILAFVLAAAMLIGGIPDTGMTISAEAAESGGVETPSELDVILSSRTAVYTGKNVMPAVTVMYGTEDVTTEAAVTWTVKESQDRLTETVNAGTYTCSASYQEGSGDSAVTVFGTADFIVDSKTLTDDMVEDIEDQTYDGREKRPVVVTDTFQNKVLTENKDFTVSYTDNVNAAQKVTATISGKGNYTGTVTKEFAINPQGVSADNVSLSKKTGVYVRAGQNIEVRAPFSAYEISFYKNSVEEANKVNKIVDVGNYKVRVKSADSNYSGAVDLDYSVAPKPVSDNTIVIEYDKAASMTYNGKLQKPMVTTVKDGEKTLTEGNDADYTVTYGSGDFTSRGSYTVTVNGKGNYGGKAEKTFTIQTGSTTVKEADFIIEGTGYKSGYYRSDVTVKVDGYKLSETESDDTSYKDFLSYSETLTENKNIYLKDVNTGAVSGPVMLSKDKFTIIKTAPSVNAAVDSSEAESWTVKKVIKINSPKENVNYYYSKTPCTLTEVNEESSLEGLTVVTDGMFTVNEAVGESAVTYYIYAVDKAGNIASSSVNIKLIDNTEPTIQVIKNNTHYDAENDVFWKNNEDLSVLIAAEDESSGVASVEVNPSVSAVVSSDKRSVIFKSLGEYTLTVKDQAGNRASVDVTVKQDTGIPSIAVCAPTEDSAGNKLELYDDGDTCWINRDSVRLPFEITDDEDENGERAKIGAEYSIDNGINWTTLDDTDIVNSYITVENLSTDTENYLFRVFDLAGNKSKINEEKVNIRIAADIDSPVINSVNFTQENDSGWINSEDAGTDGTLEISVTAEDGDVSSGIGTISYVFSQDANKTGDDYEDVDFRNALNVIEDEETGTYQFRTAEAFGSADYPDGIYYWIIRVTDKVGHYTEYSVISKIDTAAPEETAYARFISDTEGVNKGETAESEGSWTGKIYSFVSEKWNQIWGKKKVQFELYLMDLTSGIADAALTYNADGTEKVLRVSDGSLSLADGLKAFQEGDFSAADAADGDQGYAVITGSITVNENEDLAVSNFILNSVTDRAGNVREDLSLNKGENIVYLDTVAPELTAVTVDGVSVTAGGPFYYSETKNVRLEINERFFAEAVEHDAGPVIEVWSRNDTEKNFEKNEILTNEANTAKWEITGDISKSDSGEYMNAADVELPIVNGEDTEYQIKVRFEDPSGNAMISRDGISGIVNGEYSSQIFVFSNQKPELTAYSVSGITDRKINGADVYHMGKNGAEDVALAFSIKDNDAYWSDEMLAENLTFEIYNLSVDSDIPSVILKGNQLDWTANGNIHNAVYNFSGDEEPANYRVTIAYRNPFGNSMKLADTFEDDTEESDFDGIQGVYTSAVFILDHENPLYTVSYNEAYRLVKDGEGNAGAVNDRMHETPLTGYTAYYNDDIDICFTVEEDYAIISEEGELNSDFELSVVQDGSQMADLPHISWSEEGGIYKGRFTLSEEGTYEITMKYRDAAGNVMAAGSEVMGSKTDTAVSSDGVYTSTTLVLDKTTPEIILDYVGQSGDRLEPSAVIGEQNRKYFNENVYLRVEVKDKNIRYSEFKEALLDGENLNVCDVLGNEIQDNSVAAFLNQESFAPDTVSHDGVIWNIPLFFQDRENYGANYGFTICYEDLAGNGGKESNRDNTVTAYATFDKTLPEQDVYICFTSDTSGANSQSAELMGSADKGWVSKVLEFLSDKWLKIFGKEKITFMVYLRDVTSGVDSVSMQYRKDENSTVSFDTAGMKASEAEIKISQSEKERENEDLLAGYMALEGSITVPSGQDAAIDQFSIMEIRDKAGNIRNADDFGSSYILHNVDSETNLLYLDRIAPVLDIDYTENSVTDEENGAARIFYKDTAILTYMLTERFFQANTDNGKNSGNPIEPTVIVEGENQQRAEVSEWTAAGSQNYDALATVKFPAAVNSETEYNYTVAYEDAAGNFIEAGETCKGTAVNGIYTDYTIIVDNLAPKLTMFEIQGDTDRTVDSVPVYHNDGSTEQNDVTVAFTVDDNTSYWNPAALIFEIYNTSAGSTEPCVSLDGSALEWQTSGRLHSTTYGFDGENETPADYYVKIRYADRAGNNMVSGSTSVNAGQFSEGVYTSSHFILDHAAPVFNISYNEAVRVVNQDTSVIKDSDIKTPQTGYTSYYNDKIDVEFSIAEHYAVTEGSQIVNQKEDKDFILSVMKDGARMEAADMPEVTWTRTVADGVPLYKARFTLNRDGRYQISVSCRDAAMNKMEAGNIVQGSNTAEAVTTDGVYGTYTSTLLVLDSHAPAVSFAYVDAASKKEVTPQNIFESTKRNYFNQSVYLQICVDDTVSGAAGTGNIRYQELKNALTLNAADSGGKALKNTKAQLAINGMNPAKMASDMFVIELPMTDEANYDILLEGFEDLAGNKVSVMTTKACIDSTKPEVTLSCKLSDNSGFADSVTYGKKDIWFADSTLLVTAAVTDAAAGVREIEFTISDTDDDGKTLYRTQIYNPPETVRWKKKQTFTVPIPLETADFTGTITAAVSDWSNNTVKAKQESVIESQKRHNKTALAEIRTKTKPSRVVDGVNYYNTDVKFTFSMKDSYSGIRDYTITPGKDPVVSQDFAKEKASDICYSYQKNVTLSSKRNNVNGVNVSAKYTDNTNHSEFVKQKYNIDVTAPVIDVTYNLNNPASERYYKDTRVATVTITERNFDPKDVEFRITNSDGTQPAISGWSKSGTGDATRNTCTITYSSDGDYTFSVAFQDKAGNRASYNRVDEFTIDQTKPAYTVTYDNNDFENEYYYKKERTATIDVLEHNFDPSGIKVSVTKNGVTADAQLSGWSSNGDHNIASVPFHADGEYTFTISGMDLAQNEMEPYPADHFVVDMTAPNLEIQNIEHMSANNDVVAPRIVYSDTNYDESRTEIIYEGYNNGKVDYSANGVTSRSSEGAVIEMNDVERIQENDDIYTMKVTVYDKAGNSSKAEKIFSVNRFGSVYTFEDAKTNNLVGGKSPGYTNTAQDIRVKETNVDLLKQKEITCNRDGELLPMKEGIQYGVAKSGSDVTWKQYTYTLYKDNFEEEGHYTIKILSEDRAENISDNDTKGKKIEFVMDTTAPSALVSGVEDNGRYQTSSQDVTVDVEDNVLLGRVQLYVNNKMVADYEDMKELMELNGMINYSIAEQNYAQSFKVVATDAAGNDYTAEISNFTVNTSMWRLFLANKALVYGSMIALFMLAAFFWFIILAKKRKKEEEE